jgi:uncharacterized membrane protein
MNGTHHHGHRPGFDVPRGPEAWLRSRFFVPLALPSVLALALYAGWDAATHKPWDGPRLHLNLALAWAPYVFSLWAVSTFERQPRARLRRWLIGLAWLAFFPNAPYLVTDWLYLPNWTAELWYSIVLLTTFSAVGLLLTVVSLYLMHNLVRTVRGPFEGWCVAIAAIFLGGIGVYLGRFLRLNSWQLLTDPGQVWRDVMTQLHEHGDDPRPLAFAAGFAAFLFVFYLVFRSIRLAPRSYEEGPP